MSLTDDLYRDIILEHFKSPHHHGKLEPADITVEGVNPFCGDEVTLTARVSNGIMTEIQALAKGCSISQASTSMLTDAVQGQTLADAQRLAAQFKQVMLEGGPAAWPEALEDLEALEGVKKYPVRIKCAIMAWNALLEGIQDYTKETAVTGGAKPSAISHQPSASASTGLTETQVREALQAVEDPELHWSIIELGLVYGVQIGGGLVTVDVTLTSPGCPYGPMLLAQIHHAVKELPGVQQVKVNVVWTPPWDPRTMATDDVKMELGIG
ncbi:MAG: SUF system NifU family Fe-S cluster assembly protein [Candidatus Omnitrophica bacterium]|nr:SUF system NifU family Fe-S cluster assembly protein [Candidatus Omnitrophota bacterium]